MHRVWRRLAAAVHEEVCALESRVLPQLMYFGEQNLVHVVTPGGEVQKLTPRELRSVCRSPTNDMSRVPEDLAPLDFVQMGNYAVSVRWSDGHQSLLPFSAFIEGYA